MGAASLYAVGLANGGGNSHHFIYSSDGGINWSSLGNKTPASNYHCSLSACGDYVYVAMGSRTETTSWIGRYSHGSGGAVEWIDVKSVLSLGAKYSVRQVEAISDTEIYILVSYYAAYHTCHCRLYRFNGNWSSPSAGDFTYLGYTANGFGLPGGMCVIDSNNIYFTVETPYATSYEKPLIYYNGSYTLTNVTSVDNSDYPSLARGWGHGCFEYNNEVYVYTGGKYYTGGDWYYFKRIWKGTGTSFSKVVSWSNNGAENQLSQEIFPDGSLYIAPDTGEIFINDEFGQLYTKLCIYDGASWTRNTISGYYAPAMRYATVIGLNSEQVYIIDKRDSPYYQDYLYYWNGTSMAGPINPSGYTYLDSVLPYDSSPYLDSGPLTPNNKYFTIQPMVWSIGDY